MITIALLKFLEDNNIGKIDETLFWQSLDMNVDDPVLYVSSIGQAQTRGARRVQRYEIYTRAKSKLDSLKLLESVIELINSSYSVCELPAVAQYDVPAYGNINLMPLSTPTKVGEDANGRIVWSASGNIIY